MSFHVALKVHLPCRVPGTEVALKGSLASVNANMCIHVALLNEALATIAALVWALARVYSLVPLQVSAVFSRVATHVTLLQMFPLEGAQVARSWLARFSGHGDRVCTNQTLALSTRHRIKLNANMGTLANTATMHWSKMALRIR